MNYHFMIDDKFFNNLIDDIEKVSTSESNQYYILSEKINSVHVSHPKAKWIGGSDKLIQILNSITSEDRIFIHWYDLNIGKLILKIDKTIPLYVSLMGGEFYSEPLLFHREWLFDKKTLQFFNRLFIYPKKWSKNPVLFLKQIRRIWLIKKRAKNDFKIKTETIKRINYLLVGENMNKELSLVSKLYKTKKFKHLPFIFNQNFDLAISLPICKKESNSTVIQIGNSATYENNHLDLLPIIQRFGKEDININIPLAYGSPIYANEVKNHYSPLFNEKVKYIEDFVPKEEYVKKLQQVDICIMYHNRSQALGNCISLLTLGKKLYLKTNNPLWSLFKNIGVVVYDVNSIKSLTFQQFIEPLTKEEIESNILRLSATFSEKKRLSDLSEILRN